LILSIGKIALGQHRYYEQQVAQGHDDYYSGRGEAPGEWVGTGAEALGLCGRVSAQQFTALLSGLDPRQPQVRLRSSEREPKVAALDLTFSAPKSVSVLAAVAPELITAELIHAHEQALRAALSYLEDTGVQVRRGHDGKQVQPGDGLIAAAYRHRMSRALDPQLHTHVVVANMTRGPDGRYTALHGTPLYRAAKTAGYLYQSHLRALVSERLRLQWRALNKGAAELQGIPDAVLEEFSTRRHEMLREAQRGGISLTSKAAAEKAALATRERKRYGVETHTWRAEVRARAAEMGLGEAEVKLLLERELHGKPRVPAVRLDERALGDRLAGPKGLTERSNTFDERDVLREFAAASQSGSSVDELRAMASRFVARADVIESRAGEMTTSELLACERALIGSALAREDEVHILDGELANDAIRRVDTLTDEQAAAVAAVASSSDAVSVIEALAGTGKTFIAGVVRETYEREGFAVIGTAPTARAARELQDQARVSSRTLDRLLLDVEHFGDELPRRCVVILDEAGMAPTRLTARLLQAAQRSQAKVIAIGDPRQLPAVQAGGWLGALARACGAVRLSHVVRQRDGAERAALAALRAGRSHRYLEWASRARRIETFSERSSATQRALALWQEAQSESAPAQAVMIVRDNDTRAALNAAARENRRALGLLGECRDYARISIAVGDRVICRRNDARLNLDNGTRGTVRELHPERVVVETDRNELRELPHEYAAEHLEHAYALTAHAMQGATVERAIVLASPHDLTGGWSYTALSRARERTQLLILDGASEEREPFAPRTSRRQPLLQRVARRMLERDDEDLALVRMPRAQWAPRRVAEPATTHLSRSALGMRHRSDRDRARARDAAAGGSEQQQAMRQPTAIDHEIGR